MKLESTLSDRAGMLYVAPLVNVVLLLLIFFLFGSNLVLRSGISVQLPTSDSSLPSAEDAHIVTIIPQSTDEIYLNDERLRISSLHEKLPEIRKRSQQVVILGDISLSYGHVMQLTHLFLKNDFEVVHATQQESAAR